MFSSANPAVPSAGSGQALPGYFQPRLPALASGHVKIYCSPTRCSCEMSSAFLKAASFNGYL
jgi:hypothetical protein